MTKQKRMINKTEAIFLSFGSEEATLDDLFNFCEGLEKANDILTVKNRVMRDILYSEEKRHNDTTRS